MRSPALLDHVGRYLDKCECFSV